MSMVEQQNTIRILTRPLTVEELKTIARERFGDMVKAVVDVRKRVVAIGGELHADEEALLLDQGSHQDDLWGINIYVDQPRENWIEFDALINIRPSRGNRSRLVENAATQKLIVEIVHLFIR